MTEFTHKKSSDLPIAAMFVWSIITVIPFCLTVAGLFVIVPALFLKFAGLEILLLILLGVAGLTSLVLIVLCIAGFLKGWYLTWIVSRLSFYYGSFMVGLGIVIMIFNLPYVWSSALFLLGMFILLKFSLMCIESINSKEIRQRYSVVHYSHY